MNAHIGSGTMRGQTAFPNHDNFIEDGELVLSLSCWRGLSEGADRPV